MGQNEVTFTEAIERFSQDHPGEHIYFEKNPADLKEPHIMRDVNKSNLTEPFVWFPSKVLSREIITQIVKLLPVSRYLSETHKQIICSRIPCPCCNSAQIFVILSCQGAFLKDDFCEEDKIDGIWRIDVTFDENNEKRLKIKFYRLQAELFNEKQ